MHLACRRTHFEEHDVRERVLHFSRDLEDGERDALRGALEADP